MKKINRKYMAAGSFFIAGVLCLSSFCGAFPTVLDIQSCVVQAAAPVTYTQTVNGITWSYIKGTIYDKNWNPVAVAQKVVPADKDSLPKDVVIPDELDGLAVNSIGENAFSGCMADSIQIPDSVKTIWANAFADCPNLMSVKMPSQLSMVYRNAFKNCKGVTEAVVTTALDSSFAGCTNLKKITFVLGAYSTGVQVWGHAFENCTSLTDIIFPDTMQSLAVNSYAFSGCGALEKVSTGTANLTIGKNGFADCGKLSAVNFSGTVYAKTGAFKNDTALAELNFEGDARFVCGAFSRCTSLNQITFQANAVQSYSPYSSNVFEGCTGLKKVIFNGEKSDIQISGPGITVERKYPAIQHTVHGSQEMVITKTYTTECALVFDGNGGIVDGLYKKASKVCEKNSTAGALKNAGRSGYRFDGWYSQPEGGEKISSDTPIGDVDKKTVYAHWTKESR